MSLFLNCEEAHYNSWDGSGRNLLHCPNASAVARFKRAVQMGDITWHAAATDQEAVSAATVALGCVAATLTVDRCCQQEFFPNAGLFNASMELSDELAQQLSSIVDCVSIDQRCNAAIL